LILNQKYSDPSRFISGHANYLDNISLPGMVHTVFVRSPYAHARIKKIDTSKLEKNKNVVFILNGTQASKLCKPIPTYLYTGAKVNVPEWRCLAVDTVNFAGEPIIAILTKDKYLLEDVAELVKIEFEQLPVVLDVDEALKPTSTLVHEKLGTNLAIDMNMRGGDVDSAFRVSNFTIKTRVKMHRHAAAPLEVRGAIADYNERTGVLTVWASTQLPFILRSHIAQLIGIPENSVHVIAPDVGGGFGAKLQISPEYLAICLLAILSKKPVKWVETRTESLTSFAHAREHAHEIEAAFANDGRLLAFRDKEILDAGAYLDSRVAGPAVCAIHCMIAPYNVRALDASVQIVVTNKCPFGAYRGFGGESGVFAIERVLDIAAKRIGIDPIEIRKRNLIRSDEIPYKTPLNLEIDSVDFFKVLHRALEISEYNELRKEQDKLRKQGRSIGIGIAIVAEPSSTNTYTGVVEPSEVTETVDFGSCRIRVDADGKTTVYLGTVCIGTGQNIVARQIVARQLGISVNDVTVLQGDTETTPYDCGIRASRFSTVVLPSIFEAALRIRDRVLKVAAKILEANPEDIQLEGGKAFVKGWSHKNVNFENIARKFYASTNELPEDIEPGLAASCTFKPKRRKGLFNEISCSVHIPVVEVDLETGLVKFLRYFIVGDCGNIVDRQLVDGQIMGGLAQVIGGVFYEEMKYDENGQLLTGTFLDYNLPTSIEVPSPTIEHTVTPSSVPGGFKGMGESSNQTGYAAIVSAVEDALSPIEPIVETYLTPEKILRIEKGMIVVSR
jgi:aerobic carbon-monoxide dehydrogenase large subunit